MVRNRVFRGTLAGNAGVSATRWNRGATVSVPVLRRTPGGPHLPPSLLPLPVGERKGERAARGERRSSNLSRAAPGAARSAERTCGGWRNKALAPQRRGCPGTGRSQ